MPWCKLISSSGAEVAKVRSGALPVSSLLLWGLTSNVSHQDATLTEETLTAVVVPQQGKHNNVATVFCLEFCVVGTPVMCGKYRKPMKPTRCWFEKGILGALAADVGP